MFDEWAYTMGLVQLSRLAVSCRPGWRGQPDPVCDAGYAEVFRAMRASGGFFTETPGRKCLDIGCGLLGSDFVNRFAQVFPDTRVVALDWYLPFLSRDCDRLFPLCADAARLPFADASFHLAFAGGIIFRSVLAEQSLLGIAAEVFRVLEPGGIFAFTYAGQDREIIPVLTPIGFAEPVHFFRIDWIGSSPEDVYAARRPATGLRPSCPPRRQECPVGS